MKQRTLAMMTGFEQYTRKTRRAIFLEEMEQVVPWGELCALVEPHYPQPGKGRRPVGVERMLRIYFLQQWFNLSDPAVEEALYDSAVMRQFVGIDLGCEPAPDETTEPQASKILSLLLEYPGKICTRQELQQHLWQDNTLVDFERSLYKGIHTLRGTLGDSATAPRYIETVTGRGYRFIPIPQEPSNHGGRRRNGGKVGSVAVLPFASESADAEMELLNRRIIERVIDTMSRAPGVRVLAYNTVQHQRGKDLDSRSLGENLLVNAIAVGEMIRHNDELLLHVELIDVCDGSQLWGEQFKEHYSDVLEDPETLADKICDRLRPILAPTANSRRKERSRRAA